MGAEGQRREVPAATGEARGSDDAFDALRNLLIGPEREQLDRLLTRLDDGRTRAEETARVLPEAIELRRRESGALDRALAPSIETSVRDTVARDPGAFAAVIYPALGPMIRRAVSAAFLGMIQSIDRAVGESLSLRGLRWRLQAWRTGRPFAEIVLRNTLVYRVEQVVLMERASGVVLGHVAGGGVEAQDPDLVAAMLSALQSYMEDAFATREDAGRPEVVRVTGERALWVQETPGAVLALLVRGTPPVALRERMAEVLELLEARHRRDLEACRGDPAPFEASRDLFEGLLEARFRDRGRRISRLSWILVAILLLAPLPLLMEWFLEGRRRGALLEALAAQPGIVVTGSGNEAGRFRVRGLRDPLAADPGPFVRASGLDPERVELRFDPFQALAPAFVEARARRILEPPEGVTLRLEDGRLHVAGAATAAWAARLEGLAPALPGIEGLDRSALRVPELDALRGLLGRVEETVLYAQLGSRSLRPDQAGAVDRLAERLRRLLALTEAQGWPARVRVTGYADATGPARGNLLLSRERALEVATRLAERGVPEHALDPEGGGVLRDDGGAASLRRVEFRVLGVPARFRRPS